MRLSATCTGQAHSPMATGKQCTHVIMGRHMFPSKVPLPVTYQLFEKTGQAVHEKFTHPKK